MTVHSGIGYAAMLERFAPAEAVELAAHADACGFSGTLVDDHFQPWLPRHGRASHVWTVVGAIGARTRGEIAAGGVTAGYRVHPAVVAQAAATTASLYPGRHWIALSAGDALDEHVVGGYWPEAPERIARMFEAVDLVSRLFASAGTGRVVKHRGGAFELESTRLWTEAVPAPRLLVATAGPVTARRAGRVADGILTIATTPDKAAMLVDRFADGRREAGRSREDASLAIRIDLSWAPTDEQAMENALAEWPIGAVRFPRGDVRSPFDFEQLARMVRPSDFEGRMPVSADPDVHRAHIQRFADLGFDRIHLHNAGPDQRAWMDVFARDVLPKVTR